MPSCKPVSLPSRACAWTSQASREGDRDRLGSFSGFACWKLANPSEVGFFGVVPTALLDSPGTGPSPPTAADAVVMTESSELRPTATGRTKSRSKMEQ